ncbi:hypothetical protein ACUY3K_05885 [Corynebacterium uberis]|uniref:hypothetical protein n=1 Tax=Corynebacterium TaxID=1716 RepID=UPI001D09DA5B|nr:MULTISPECIES: hypothetical protein [Corynebacterium]MCZ9308224.1 hypothetical protein [Corynebacterium sp. c6VSa_13]UDL73904.1 hypothetical protein LH391_01355 [Corynebacterium uberis]UDL75213.1 hypothetical protein LH393_08060 [Corynebacterium uberis]UDL77424.1 hypothetical protein LH394_08040 [Corynebacterium uberis]UDL79709.1 hypothetical protein LH392_08465 [Corynebacterium uberis]
MDSAPLIQQEFSHYVSERSFWLSATSKGETVIVTVTDNSSYQNAPEFPVELSQEEWDIYYRRVSKIDKYPFSMMKIHLEEAIASALNQNMRNVTIVYDGCFAPKGTYYTPPQT